MRRLVPHISVIWSAALGACEQRDFANSGDATPSAKGSGPLGRDCSQIVGSWELSLNGRVIGAANFDAGGHWAAKSSHTQAGSWNYDDSLLHAVSYWTKGAATVLPASGGWTQEKDSVWEMKVDASSALDVAAPSGDAVGGLYQLNSRECAAVSPS